MKKIISVILAVMLAASLCACAGTVKDKDTATASGTAAQTDTEQTGAAPGGASKADYGWISFTMPDGFADAKETDQYVTVQSKSNNKIFFRIARDYMMDMTLDAIVNLQVSNNPENYSVGKTLSYGGFTYKTVNFKSNGAESRMFFAEAGDGVHFLRVTAFGLTEDDQAIITVLESIVLDKSKL